MHDFKSPQRHLHAIFHVPSYQLRRQTHAIRSRTVPLLLPRLLRIAAHNLDLLRRDIVLIVELEVDVFDKERPDFVAEAVGIQMTLFFCNEPPISLANNLSPRRREKEKGSNQDRRYYLEVHARLDLIGQHLGDGLVKGSDDFHGSLGFDALSVDEVVKGVDEGHADAVVRATVSASHIRSLVASMYLLPR